LETKVKSKALHEFQEVTETIINPDLKKWLGQGGKIVGYFCAAMPVELMLLPPSRV